MLCDNCESELRKNWKFCPACGAEIIHEDIFISLGNILKSITREMESDFLAEKKTPGYRVDTAESGFGGDVEEGHAGKRSRTMQKSRAKAIEPKTHVKNLGNRIVFEIKLPGVNPDDAHLTELDESFEVKAYSKDAYYFKIITVPQGFSLADQYFESGKLVLKFAT